MTEGRSELVALWEEGDYTPIGELFAPIHEELLDACEPLAGRRLLDVATGTGGVALRAVARGAEVVGSDFSRVMLARARERAAALGAAIELVEADARELLFPDASFDVVTSCFGMVFAPDAAAVAGELTRVCRPGGRLAYTVWLPDEADAGMYDGLPEPAIQLGQLAEPWRDEPSARGLLEPAFDLAFRDGEFDYVADSADALWDFSLAHVPPFAVYVSTLGADDREELRRRYLAAHEPEEDGRIHDRGTYLVVTGTRR